MRQINDYKIVGWDVDTQRDFMENGKNPIRYTGKLAIEGAMDIEDNLAELQLFLRQKQIPIMGSVDWHSKDADEFPKLGEEPDFMNTFPEHCVRDTYGAEKIDATRPENPMYIGHDTNFDLKEMLRRVKLYDGEVYFQKDRFDVFDENGNHYAKPIVEGLGIEKALVYGVALEVCNNFAVKGLRDLGIDVYAVEDCMKAINEEVRPQILNEWEKLGAKVVKLEQVLKGELR